MESTYLGKYYFEVSMILRESLLLNSEAWVNYTDKDIRVLEQSDEMLLSSIVQLGPASVFRQNLGPKA